MLKVHKIAYCQPTSHNYIEGINFIRSNDINYVYIFCTKCGEIRFVGSGVMEVKDDKADKP